MDFTQTTYKTLIQSLQKKFSNFNTFKDFIQHSNTPILQQSIILHHDVDHLPQNSLKLAQLEHSLGIKGTYYFRIVPESFDLEIMHKIAELGHEIGYHYEDVDLVVRSQTCPPHFQRRRESEVRGQKPVNSKEYVVDSNEKQGKNGIVEKWRKAIMGRKTFQHSNIPKAYLIDEAYESFCKNL